MQKSLTTWMIVMNSIFLFSPSFFNLGNLVLQLRVQNVLLHSLQVLALRLNVQRPLVEIGAWAYVQQILVEPETMPPASLLSKLAIEQEFANIHDKTSSFLKHGPHSLASSDSCKRKADQDIVVPRYHRRFAWSDRPAKQQLSPAALYTETVPPLASPPPHLLNDPIIQRSLHSLGDAVKVKTPFNVDRFESLLVDHPNQPFVRSVMKGLWEGFWPFDEGNWKLELEEVIGNYSTGEPDLEAIHAFHDKELLAG